ncbi:MAG: ABC transporter permease [Clostridia bacterium]|nr:ABC transporter permease [Clostridia bacterium]
MTEKKRGGEGREPLIHLSKRAAIPFWHAWLIRIAAVALGMVACGLVAYLLSDKLQNGKKTLSDFYETFITGSFGSERKLWKFLKDVAVLLCISLALVPAFKMRFWNIGGEGQTLVSVLGAVAVAFYLQDQENIPEWLLLLLMCLGALVSGAIWALIPALFRAKWGTNETLFTLMMNYVATYLVSLMLIVWIPNGQTSLGTLKRGALRSVTEQVINKNDFKDFIVDYIPIILIAIILSALLFIYLRYTKHGYEISVVGESINTARYIGINEKKVIIRTMLLSGMLCGIAGFLIAAGLDQTVNVDSAQGYGFTGIMVAWLGKFNPLIMLLTAGIIQLLDHGAAQISKDFNVRGAFPEVIVGIILFFIIGSEFFINYQVHFRKFRKKTGKEAVQ